MQIAARVRELSPPQIKDELPANSLPPQVAAKLHQLNDELHPLLDSVCCTPLNSAIDCTRSHFQETVMERIQLLRHLARVLQAECLDAESKGDRQRAIVMANAMVRLGTMLCRNGIDVDCLVGHAVMGTANDYFIKTRMRFSSEDAAKVIEILQRAQLEHEPIERICQRDRAYTERAFGWQGLLSAIIEQDDGLASLQTMRQMYDRWIAIHRLLETDLAIRQYEREHGEWPTSLADLIPGHLGTLPIDPFCDAPLVYRLRGDDFVLYSVGKDGVDDGGRFGDALSIYKEGFDFDLDAFTREHGAEVSPSAKPGRE
jgi:hypothetical protein